MSLPCSPSADCAVFETCSSCGSKLSLPSIPVRSLIAARLWKWYRAEALLLLQQYECHVVKSRIQKAPNCASFNAFSSLQNFPTSDDTSTGGVHVETASARSEEDQIGFELKCAREQEVAILHDVSHRHNRGLLTDLIAAGVETRHLNRHILKHNCKWCAANRAGETSISYENFHYSCW